MIWNETFATGIESIDRQHKMLFQATSDFRDALDEGRGDQTYAGLLDFLDRYCRAHFDNENRCMERYRCPIAQRNRDAHANFVKVLGEFKRRHTEGGYSAENARRMIDTLDAWLVNHICTIDVQLREAVTS